MRESSDPAARNRRPALDRSKSGEGRCPPARIQRKNLLDAETCARKMGIVDLAEALDLVCLVAEAAPARLNGFARRWLARLAGERALTLAELDLSATALRALPSARARDRVRALL
jgi:hypothetical protein